MRTETEQDRILKASCWNVLQCSRRNGKDYARPRTWNWQCACLSGMRLLLAVRVASRWKENMNNTLIFYWDSLCFKTIWYILSHRICPCSKLLHYLTSTLIIYHWGCVHSPAFYLLLWRWGRVIFWKAVLTMSLSDQIPLMPLITYRRRVLILLCHPRVRLTFLPQLLHTPVRHLALFLCCWATGLSLSF